MTVNSHTEVWLLTCSGTLIEGMLIPYNNNNNIIIVSIEERRNISNNWKPFIHEMVVQCKTSSSIAKH